ncbi:hypothetical protein AGDE_15456 [Angomonas deanei]|uniref:NAA35-like TPR repeats domain-containing protein n=1 Tax=Angomonas deanei TaxID=59799 RepID=A0A7G2CQA9_9TRYP|nr:hypothetical protein AGDE_15456 [Angomonas deanei]CAD2221665.1 hypothetical protein, conserved [Angomonas deanei]|eukprot:EPY19031.1 hypothetical protein AGDE_15456 [Angomonas deanei]
MEVLKAQNPLLHLYCRAVLRTVSTIMKPVFATTIRSDEEYSYPPPELERVMEEEITSESDEAFLATLQKAVEENEKAGKKLIASRLQLRVLLLSALNTLIGVKRRSDLEKGTQLCEEALTLWSSAVFDRTADPAVPEKFCREQEMQHWVSVLTPNRPIPTPSYKEVREAYLEMLRQMKQFAILLELHSLQEVTEYVESVGASKTLLHVRAILIIILFCKDYNESFLFGLPLPQQILSQLAKEYGAPLYLKVYEGDETMTEAVTRYRIHKLSDPSKLTPAQYAYFKEETRDAIRKWTDEACKNYLLHIETMLCNRGLTHQRLLKSFYGFSQFQERSYACDMNIFLASLPGVDLSGNKEEDGKNLETEFVKSATVLTLYANAYIFRAMELVLRLGYELDLYTQGEQIAVLWYLNFTLRAQTENFNTLYLQNNVSGVLSHIPETRVNKRTGLPVHNVALTTRVAGLIDPVNTVKLEALRSLTDAIFISSNLFEFKKLINLTDGPDGALITPENVFNHRFLKYFGLIRSPPFASYKRCVAAKIDFVQEEKDLLLYATRSSELAQQAVSKIKTVINGAALQGTQRQIILKNTLEELERTAVTTAASLAAFAAVCEEQEKDIAEKYVSRVERPGDKSLVCFSFRKKQ